MKSKKVHDKQADKEFTVTWELTTYEKSPKDAAECALELLFSSPWKTEIFQVKNVETGEVKTVRVRKSKVL